MLKKILKNLKHLRDKSSTTLIKKRGKKWVTQKHFQNLNFAKKIFK